MAVNLDFLLRSFQLVDSLSDAIKDPFVAAVRDASIGGPLLITPTGNSSSTSPARTAGWSQIDVAAKEDTINLDCGSGGDSLPLCDSGDTCFQIRQVDPYGMALERLDDRWRVYLGMKQSGTSLAWISSPTLPAPETPHAGL